MDVRISLCASQLISWALKLTTMYCHHIKKLQGSNLKSQGSKLLDPKFLPLKHLLYSYKFLIYVHALLHKTGFCKQGPILIFLKHKVDNKSPKQDLVN